ncbi:MAG: PhnD/SsuA/transferrin family substrate-binding protein [Candidatus Schekmanbacteria bacterium]|nr:PhnD/SsuA/transferrin family substrate-binding protein [Candidatus Schekmanbacteria bacterium]
MDRKLLRLFPTCFGLLAAVWFFAPRAAALDDRMLTLPERPIVYYNPDTMGREPAEIVLLFQAWVDAVIAPEAGARGKVLYFSRRGDLEAYMDGCRRSGEYPLFGALHAETVLEKRNDWGLDLFAYAIDVDGNAHHSVAVIVRQDSPVRRLEDLKNRVVVAPDYWGKNVRRFEKVVLENKVALADLKSLDLTPSSISALMGVQYRSADAAFASSRVFSIMRTKSSAVWRALRIIHQSPSLPISTVVTFKAATPRQREYMKREAARMHETTTGRKALDYVRLQRIVLGKLEDLFSPQELREAVAHEPTAVPAPVGPSE